MNTELQWGWEWRAAHNREESVVRVCSDSEHPTWDKQSTSIVIHSLGYDRVNDERRSIPVSQAALRYVLDEDAELVARACLWIEANDREAERGALGSIQLDSHEHSSTTHPCKALVERRLWRRLHCTHWRWRRQWWSAGRCNHRWGGLARRRRCSHWLCLLLLTHNYRCLLLWRL